MIRIEIPTAGKIPPKTLAICKTISGIAANKSAAYALPSITIEKVIPNLITKLVRGGKTIYVSFILLISLFAMNLSPNE